MRPTRQLHDLGQSLWLDNITRALLDNGTLRRYIEDFSITGLTSNPTIFDGAIGGGDTYDTCIREKAEADKSGKSLFIELALEDLRRAADLFRPVFDASHHIDGWVSMEVSPLLASDTDGSIKAAGKIHQQADRPNLFVKIPGTAEGVPAIEASIFAGVPVNITLLFSREQYLAAANAYMRGIERRIAAGLDPKVASVASLFVSRWDVAIKDKVPMELRTAAASARRSPGSNVGNLNLVAIDGSALEKCARPRAANSAPSRHSTTLCESTPRASRRSESDSEGGGGKKSKVLLRVIASDETRLRSPPRTNTAGNTVHLKAVRR